MVPSQEKIDALTAQDIIDSDEKYLEMLNKKRIEEIQRGYR